MTPRPPAGAMRRTAIHRRRANLREEIIAHARVLAFALDVSIDRSLERMQRIRDVFNEIDALEDQLHGLDPDQEETTP